MSEDIFEQFASLSLEELAAHFTLHQQKRDDETEINLDPLLQFLNTHQKWESLGSILNENQLLNIMNYLIGHSPEQLAEILIGLQPKVFSNALSSFQEEHLALFKNESLLEPLQYHLTQFIHEGESILEILHDKIERFESDLKTVKITELTGEQFQRMIGTVHSFRIEILHFLEKTSAALLIGWNTERIDLIEKLSNLNEKLQFILGHVVGHPVSENLASTGLYYSLKKSLSSIFDASLKDEDASLEGLSRLSVWHLKDYWEMGLLPGMGGPQFLKLSEQHPQELFTLVQATLEKLNIGTVGDLKRENIFSKDLLITYIQNQPFKLANM